MSARPDPSGGAEPLSTRPEAEMPGPTARAPFFSIPAALLLTVLALQACGANEKPTDPPVDHLNAGSRVHLTHDFGIVQHGDTVSTDVEILLPDEPGPWIPVGYQRSCSCARHQFALVDDATGAERFATEQPYPEYAAREGETLILRLSLVTEEKEMADLPRTSVRGTIVLQSAGGVQPNGDPIRSFLDFTFHYGINAPFRILPGPRIDIGRITRSQSFAQPIAIIPDDPAAALGTPRLLEDDPDRADALRPPLDATIARIDRDTVQPSGDDDGWRAGEQRFRLSFTPGRHRPAGPFRFDFEIALPDGRPIRVPVSGEVAPDLEVRPFTKVAFGRIPFDEKAEQSVVIVDHDTTRSPDFHVARIRDQNGRDTSELFRARFDRRGAGDDPRARRLVLEFTPPEGGVGPEAGKYLRGNVVLSKEPGGTEVLTIPYLALRRD